MTTTPILYDTHMHTPLCKHATGRPEEYAAVAEKRGLKGIIVTCHNPTDIDWAPKVRMARDEFEQYIEMVAQARAAWEGRIDVRLGLESDYAPGMEAWLEDLHSRADFHYILGSVHAPYQEYRDRYFNGDIPGFQRTYFEHLAVAAETGLFDCLAHPDLVKNVHPAQWQVPPLLDSIRAALDRIAITGVAMELNTYGLKKVPAEMHPGREILAEMQARQIPVVVGSDAHTPARVGADFERALDLLAEIGFTHVSTYLYRERQEIEIGTARESLRS